ncbi:hypothetical protein Scep_016131 [Stephania cephalantha]|uniref:Gfo/Idh/MocA-like oxidoreductase N-terminal domain-containing protein n=1 Tax=Stephania cephalantha TaxID=152367 RepID=A0AAP0IN81_9MAGN
MAAADQNPVKFGVIGCARIARKLIRAISLSPTTTLAAIGSRSLSKAQKFLSENRIWLGEAMTSRMTVKVYGSYEGVVEDEMVEAVYLPVPTRMHVKWAVAAAERGKHVLVEKPVGVDVGDVEVMVEACRVNGVQFMDGTMWLHHPRTRRLRGLLDDQLLFGDLRMIHSSSTFRDADEEFFKDNIRVKADLDALGALGDAGWYCIGAILWANNYKLPSTVTALPKVTRNDEGVILDCGASFHWEGDDVNVATFHCSFLCHESMDLTMSGSKGTITLRDFIIPYQEHSASFDFSSDVKFVDLHIGWTSTPKRVEVSTELPQEALMVQEFGRLVHNIKVLGSSPDEKWPGISTKTQLLLDAVKKSIDAGFKTITV